jgi:hypothetical protein
MSFGQTDAGLNSHIAELYTQRSRGRARRQPTPRQGRTRRTLPLQNRIGATMVEVGLHLMVRSRHSEPAARYRPDALRPSSAAHGR